MYKKYLYIPKTLVLNLNFKKRKKTYEFKEPTMYELMIFEDMIEEEKYLEAIKFLKINIKESDFMSNPLGILKAIFQISYGNKEGNTEGGEPSFMPSIFDLLAKRYGKTPLEVLKEVTPSILDTYLAGFEFNMNIETGEKHKNYKFKEKKKISELEIQSYDDIMKRVEEAEKRKKEN